MGRDLSPGLPTGTSPSLAPDDDERALRRLALQTSNSILVLQRRAEQQLHDAKRQLESQTVELASSVSLLAALLDSSPTGIIAVDRSGRVIAHNARFADIWGFAPDEMQHANASDLAQRALPLLKVPTQLAGRVASMMSDPDVRTHDIVDLIDGRVFEREAVPYQIDGRTVGTVVHWRDITEQRRSAEAEAELAEQVRQAQKMESLGALAGGIAHDFNNMLGAILGNVEIALDFPDEPGTVQESLAEIRLASERATQLVQQILTFSRRQRQALGVLSLEETVRDATRLLRATIPAGVELICRADPSLPRVLADGTQIHQIVLNLGTNAWHALQTRTAERTANTATNTAVLAPRISFEISALAAAGDGRAEIPAALPAGPVVRLSVRDNGSGMDRDTVSRIFEPFFTTRLTGEGTGLGLSVVHGIMESHHGAITVDSTPGTGTVFHLYFPALPDDVADQAARRATPPPRSALVVNDRGEPQHVMYIDDDPALVTLVAKLLNRSGFRVSSFDRPDVALAALRDAPDAFDVVITDFNMPAISGLDVARAVRGIRPTLPLIITTGYITAELERDAAALRVDAVLYKPEMARRLVALIRGLAPESSRTSH